MSLTIFPDHFCGTGLLPAVASAFVIRQGFGILTDFSAWLRLAILPLHCQVTGLLLGVIFFFVITQVSIILEDLTA